MRTWHIEWSEYTGDAVAIHDTSGKIINRAPFAKDRNANTMAALEICRVHNAQEAKQ